MKSRYARMISRACGRGNASIPPITIGPTGCRSNSNSVTTPKFPPPPRSPQNRSGFSSALARTTLPSAVTTSADAQARAGRPVRPLEPAAAAAEREAADARVRHTAAGDSQAVLLGGAVEVDPFRAALHARRRAPRDRPRRRSSAAGRSRSRRHRCCSRASSAHRRARRRSGRVSRPKLTAATTSSVDEQRTTIAGWRSIMPFQTLRASS